MRTSKMTSAKFSGSVNEIWDPDTIKDLDAIIGSYLIREGRFDTFDILLSECNDPLLLRDIQSQRDQFKQMFSIIQDLKVYIYFIQHLGIYKDITFTGKKSGFCHPMVTTKLTSNPRIPSSSRLLYRSISR